MDSSIPITPANDQTTAKNNDSDHSQQKGQFQLAIMRRLVIVCFPTRFTLRTLGRHLVLMELIITTVW